MESTTLSTKFQLVIPRGPRERLRLRPGMRFTVLDKGGVLYLVPQSPVRTHRGVAKGVSTRELRDKRDRL
jgi:AbrB family looped-hinge helix DNA binding protein